MVWLGLIDWLGEAVVVGVLLCDGVCVPVGDTDWVSVELILWVPLGVCTCVRVCVTEGDCVTDAVVDTDGLWDWLGVTLVVGEPVWEFDGLHSDLTARSRMPP
jgi:hypothetical protein